MNKYSASQLVAKAFKGDKRTIKDDRMLLAWVWSLEQIDDPCCPAFDKKLGEIYTHLLKRSHPATIFREARKLLEADPVLKEKYQSTEPIKVAIGEQAIPPFTSAGDDDYEIGKSHLANIKSIFFKTQGGEVARKEKAESGQKLREGL
jgi:hypothetical protein